MGKKACLLLSLSILLCCQSTRTIQTQKDIVAINEQLYNLEKEQNKTAKDVQAVQGELQQVKNPPIQAEKKSLVLDEAAVNSLYQEGYQCYLQQEYAKAIDLFGRLVEQAAEHQLVSNALFWKADAFLKLNQNDKALYFFQSGYSRFPFGNKADNCLFKIGMIYYDRQDITRARLALKKLVADYPDSDLAPAAVAKLSQINKLLRRKK